MDTCCDRIYFCPTSGETECPVHGGFDVCCARSDLHELVYAPPEVWRPIVEQALIRWKSTLDWLAER